MQNYGFFSTQHRFYKIFFVRRTSVVHLCLYFIIPVSRRFSFLFVLSVVFECHDIRQLRGEVKCMRQCVVADDDTCFCENI